MTFRKERYPANWSEIRDRIVARDGNVCKRCAAPNGEKIARGLGTERGTYCLPTTCEVFDDKTGARLGRTPLSDYEGRPVTIVLTVAHLDHDETHNTEGNLAALCQKCHFAHDRVDNARRASAKRGAKVVVRGLFDEREVPRGQP